MVSQSAAHEAPAKLPWLPLTWPWVPARQTHYSASYCHPALKDVQRNRCPLASAAAKSILPSLAQWARYYDWQSLPGTMGPDFRHVHVGFTLQCGSGKSWQTPGSIVTAVIVIANSSPTAWSVQQSMLHMPCGTSGMSPQLNSPFSRFACSCQCAGRASKHMVPGAACKFSRCL